MTIIPSKEEFFRLANGSCKSRLLTDKHYVEFCAAMREAFLCAERSDTFYKTRHGGCTSHNYGYVAQTSAWVVWVDPFMYQVLWSTGRSDVYQVWVKPLYPGGRHVYEKACLVADVARAETACRGAERSAGLKAHSDCSGGKKTAVWYDLRKRTCKDCGSELTVQGVEKGGRAKYTLYCDKCGYSIDWFSIPVRDRDAWFEFKAQR